jgi:hypothetical protein
VSITEKSKSDLLSNEFKVAAQIYECNQAEQKIWFSKLSEILAPHMSQATVMKSLRILFDWGIVKAEYGPTDKNRAGRLLFIAGESRSTIKEIYENFWKKTEKAE